MSKYEANSPLTLIAGLTVNGIRNKLVAVNSSGRAIVVATPTAHIVGVFAQDAMTIGEPVTIDQLIGKIEVIAEDAITAGKLIVPDGVDGKVIAADAGNAPPGVQVIGIAIEDAIADARFMIVAAPIGFDTGSVVTLTAGETNASAKNNIVTIDASGEVVIATAVTAPIIGTIASDSMTDGLAVQINRLTGVVNMIAGAAVVAGNIAIPHATDGAISGVDGFSNVPVNTQALGLILEAGAVNEVVEVLTGPLGHG